MKILLARLFYRLSILFLCLFAILTVGSPVKAWPPKASDIEVIATREFSGTVRNVQIRTEAELAWQQSADGVPPTLYVRLSSAVASLPADYSTGRIGFAAGIFKLGIPDGFDVDNRGAGFLSWNGAAWGAMANHVLTTDEEDAIAADIGREFLFNPGSHSFDTLQIISAYSRLLAPDVFITEPSRGFTTDSSGEEVEIVEFYWLDPADALGNPLVNRENQAASLVDVMPLELAIPFDAIENGECNFYLGYLEAVCLERVSPSSREPNEVIYNFRVWEGRIRIGDAEPEEDEAPVTEPWVPGSGPPGVMPGQVGTPISESQLESGTGPRMLPPRPGSADGMVWVPPGDYVIGSGVEGTSINPRRQVYLDGFWIDIFPVTNGQYWQFLGESGYLPEGNWQEYRAPGTDNYAARGLTYYDALKYAEYYGRRLPTEEEWEAAARGFDNRRYTWGNAWNQSYVANDVYMPVDAHPDNISPMGAREMIGNVWEWTSSHFFPGAPNRRIESGDFLILKGGAINSSSAMCEIWQRGAEPNDTAIASYGFRCVMDSDSVSSIQTIIGSAE